MDTHIEIHPMPNPDDRIRRLGFALTDPYLEQCWTALLGPSSVAFLRRMPTLWSHESPTRFANTDLAASLGLSDNVGHRSAYGRTLSRLTHFRFGEWAEPGRSLAIYTEVAPMTERQLSRLPRWTRDAHARLVADHLDQLVARSAVDSSADLLEGRVSGSENRVRTPAPLDSLRQARIAGYGTNQALGL